MTQDERVQEMTGRSSKGGSSRFNDSQRGSMLLIALAVLTLLIVQRASQAVPKRPAKHQAKNN